VYVLSHFSYSSKTLPSIHRREVVEPWIARDMEQQQTVDVKILIGRLLLPQRAGTPAKCVERFDDCRANINSMWKKKLQNKKQPIIDNLKK
jgi:hypothetical protein